MWMTMATKINMEIPDYLLPFPFIFLINCVLLPTFWCLFIPVLIPLQPKFMFKFMFKFRPCSFDSSFNEPARAEKNGLKDP